MIDTNGTFSTREQRCISIVTVVGNPEMRCEERDHQGMSVGALFCLSMLRTVMNTQTSTALRSGSCRSLRYLKWIIQMRSTGYLFQENQLVNDSKPLPRRYRNILLQEWLINYAWKDVTHTSYHSPIMKYYMEPTNIHWFSFKWFQILCGHAIRSSQSVYFGPASTDSGFTAVNWSRNCRTFPPCPLDTRSITVLRASLHHSF